MPDKRPTVADYATMRATLRQMHEHRSSPEAAVLERLARQTDESHPGAERHHISTERAGGDGGD